MVFIFNNKAQLLKEKHFMVSNETSVLLTKAIQQIEQ